MTPRAILQIKNLSKTYPGGVHALRGVSFDIAPREFAAIVGLSGSGKSTLLRCINRLIEPTEGEIFFDGCSVTDLSLSELRRLRREIGMIFQQFNLISRFSAHTNAIFGRLGVIPLWRSLSGFWSKEDEDLAEKALCKVGLGHKMGRRAMNLSGGEQQRVAIARALNQNPKLLLADEPVANLDPALAHSVMQYLELANREFGMTILCNLHTVSLVKRYASRVIALKQGELVFDGSPEAINEDWFRHVYGEDCHGVA
ncbi:MAG: phosphonate ABC transporter ATP-binding protein [Deltaproteobacteria bacterium]|nr:phosphonate ABC transporter ATP-binding protein [Deltaproteobacteria bacterium]